MTTYTQVTCAFPVRYKQKTFQNRPPSQSIMGNSARNAWHWLVCVVLLLCNWSTKRHNIRKQPRKRILLACIRPPHRGTPTNRRHGPVQANGVRYEGVLGPACAYCHQTLLPSMSPGLPGGCQGRPRVTAFQSPRKPLCLRNLIVAILWLRRQTWVHLAHHDLTHHWIGGLVPSISAGQSFGPIPNTHDASLVRLHMRKHTERTEGRRWHRAIGKIILT